MSDFFSKLRQNENVLSGLGNEATAMNQIDVARGVIPGKQEESLSGMTPSDLALLDRQAWGQNTAKQSGIPMALLGGIPIAGYEGMKAISQSPIGGFANSVMEGIGRGLKGLGYETGDEMKMNEKTSPASFGNIGAYFRGALGRDFFQR